MAESSTVEVASNDSAPQSRARLESDRWIEEKRARLEKSLAALNLSLERQKEILSMPDTTLLAGVEQWYSSAEAARFFGRTVNWLYDRFQKGKFTYSDGSPIEPVWFNKEGKRPKRRFTLEIILEMAKSCYRDGVVSREELKVIRKRIGMAEIGELFDDPDEL